MAKHVPAKKEVSIEDLAQTILKGSTEGKDSIIDYFSSSRLRLKDARSLHAVLRGKSPQSDELLDLLRPHSILKLLTNAERARFYYGYVHPILLTTAVTSIYYELDEAHDAQVSDDVKSALAYLSRACSSKVSLESIASETLKIFGEAKDLEHFSLLIRHLFFADVYSKGKHDALLAIATKLKDKVPTRGLALSLIGIWFQTKTNPISLRRIRLLKAVWEIQAMLEESKTSTERPGKLCMMIWIKTKDIMHGNVRTHR